MLGAVQTPYSDCLLAIKINGTCGNNQHLSIALKEGCPLSTILLGLFIDGSHQFLQMLCLMLV